MGSEKYMPIYVVIVFIALGILVANVLGPSLNAPADNRFIPTPAPFPMEQAEKLSVGELDNIWKEIGTELYLPAWMPGNIKLTEIYGKPPVFMLTYSDSNVKDYRYAEVVIEISPSGGSPPLESRKLAAERAGAEVVMIGDIWVDIAEDSTTGNPFAFFWHGSLYYIISGDSTISKDELIGIIHSVQPVSNIPHGSSIYEGKY